MRADVCDFIEAESGRCVDGRVCGIVGWFAKTALAAGLFLSGVLVEVSGFDIQLGAPDNSTLLNMKIFFVLIPVVLHFAALYLAANYEITKLGYNNLYRSVNTGSIDRIV